MDIFGVILSLVSSLVFFFIFLKVFLGSNPKTKSVVIYTIIYAILTIAPSLSLIINEGLIDFYLIVDIGVRALTFLGVIIYYTVVNNPRSKKPFKKYKDVSFFKLSLIRISSLIILILGAVGFVVIMLLNKKQDTLSLSLFILLILLAIWNMAINIYYLIFKIKDEKILIVNNRGYEIFDVNTKGLYKLSNYINVDNIHIEKSIKGILTHEDGSSSFVKIYFIPKHIFNEDIKYNKVVFNRILNNENKLHIKLSE